MNYRCFVCPGSEASEIQPRHAWHRRVKAGRACVRPGVLVRPERPGQELLVVVAEVGVGGTQPVRCRERGQVIQAVEAEQRGRAGRLGKVAETVVPRGLEDGLERQAGAAAVAGQDVGPAGEAKGARPGRAA